MSTALARPRRWLIGLAAELSAQAERRAAAIRAAMLEGFEPVASHDFVVRRLEVVQKTAERLGVDVVSPAFHIEVAAQARRLGWQLVRNGNRHLFRGVKRRSASLAAALVESRAHRLDTRKHRKRPKSPGRTVTEE